MVVLYLVTWFVLLPVNCLGRVHNASEERLLSKDMDHSNDFIFTAKSPGDNLISEDNKIVNSPATENEVQRKQLDANQPNNNFMSQENLGEKNDESGTKNKKQQNQANYDFISQENLTEKNNMPGTKNTKQQKQQYSNQPTFTVDHTGYNPIKEEDEKVKKKSLKSMMKKLLPGGSSPRSPLNRSNSASSSSTDYIDSLLDEYDRQSDHVETDYAVEQENKAIEQVEAIESPRKPALPIEKFSLCSEVFTTLDAVDFFSDGKAPTCMFACLYYKIKNFVYQIEPAGRCARYNMNGPSYGAPANTYVSCICSHGFRLFGRKYRYRIVQEGDILYSVQSKEFGTKLPLGTAKQIYDYVENNFEHYLIQFLKNKRGVDWKGMYEYVRDLRWIRHDKDDRSVGQYLSESLKQEIDDIKHYWTVTIPERLLKFGINRTQSY